MSISETLVSDEEIAAVCQWKDIDHQNGGEGFYNPVRRVGVLYLRKAAHKLEAKAYLAAAGALLDLAEEETPDDK